MNVSLPDLGDKWDKDTMRQFVRRLRQAFIPILLLSGPSYSEASARTIPRATTATTVTITGDDWLVLVDTTAGNVAAALPGAALVKGRSFAVKRITAGANTLTVTPVSGNIDGAGSASMPNQYDFYEFYSDGTDYWLI